MRLAEPQFEGQTKEVLGTPAVRAIVARVVEKELTERLTSTKRDEKEQAALLLEKVVSEMKSRISARLHKETQRRKNALESSSLPAKLVDCRSTDVERTELFIVEGDCALGTAKLARNSEYQALLPIRGKILNVQKASVADMLGNAECAAIIQVIGAGSGRTFDLESARYGKVIIMTDADVDGAHIRTLLLTLFFRYMRPLVEAGRVFAAVPPLHRIEVVNPGSKANEVDLHLLRGRDAAHHGGADQAGQEDQAAAALQGPGRDGCRPARRDHDGPAPPHAAPGHRRRPRLRRRGVRAAHGQRRRPAQGVHRRLRARARPRAHRRLTRELGRTQRPAAARPFAPQWDARASPDASGAGEGTMSRALTRRTTRRGRGAAPSSSGSWAPSCCCCSSSGTSWAPGVYALTGRVAGEVGGAAWAPFIVAFAVALVTAFSYLELVTKYPQAAGRGALHAQGVRHPLRHLPRRFTVMCSGITSASTASNAFAANLADGFGLDSEDKTLIVWIALAFMMLVAAVNFRGVGESVKANVVLTLVELSGLLLVIMVGMYAATGGKADFSRVRCSTPRVTRTCSSPSPRRPRSRSSRWSASRTP